MTAELRRNLVLAAIGLLGGFGLIVALFGGGELMKRPFAPSGSSAPSATTDGQPAGGKAAEERSADGKSTDGKPADAGTAGTGRADAGTAPSSTGVPGAQADKAPAPGSSAKGGAGSETEAAKLDANAPSFDLVRVEPTGETVVAGRGAPNTAVEMLVNGKPVARALADPNGQFALVPPALPPGDSEIVLRILDPQGRETRSAQSVAVVVAPDHKTRPLVALSAPGRPTVVLSQPDAVAANEPRPDAAPAERTPGAALPPTAGSDGTRTAEAKPGESKSPASKPADAKAAGAPSDADSQAGKTAAAATRPVAPGKPEASKPEPSKPEPAKAPSALKIVSVDAQEGGRLYVTGQAAPGATVRLYLNDTLVAPASVGPDGKVVFTIGKGVAAGAYRVRIDQVDSVTGAVKTRAEVPFTFPEAAARVASRDPAGDGAAASRPDQGKAVAALPPAGVKPEPGPHASEKAASVPAPATAPKAAALPPSASTSAPSATAPSTASAAASSATASRDAPKASGQAAGAPPAASSAPAPAEAQAAASGPAQAPTDAPGAAFVAEIATARITRGDNLWQISRKFYGSGVRYTVIYDANQDQIRDPDRIFPGQIFVLPKDAPNKDAKDLREGRGGRG